ncbi:hypothetical protein [Amycolatopsis sp. H20-H5]|uniref:hypothetical protein n=1 Tax=Amycolatopsis sp. H20-H5 TaxID=3046309 RepID=UPI002DB964E0|nr:hypothetical protein [Amycolatopsis sp. H20-H5]MEC3981086.1 hypothetical protein [Amycolatopsis sp. H20-H5]
MKKTMGRLAGAVLVGALITLAVSPTAMAQDDPATTAVTPPPVETPTTTPDPGTPPTGTTTPVETPTSESPAPTSSAPGTTDPGTPPATKPSETSPSSSSEPPKSSEPTTPPEDPYVDNIGAGYAVSTGEAFVVISCLAGAPTNVVSPALDIEQDAIQDETDGRFWGFNATRKAGFTDVKSTVTWTCGGVAGQGDVELEAAPGGGAGTPGTPGTPDKVTKPKQVKIAPKGGIATGFGGMAQA